MAVLGGLRLAARYGRACLILGLVIGFALPGLALALKPWLPHLIAAMIFVAAYRIGARAAWGGLRAIPDAIGTALVLQFALPFATLLICLVLGIAGLPLAMAVILMMSAPSISGSPNLTILVGHDPAPALRLMILGTAIFPLTVLPILWLLPSVEPQAAAKAGLRLLVVIAGVTAGAFVLRRMTLPEISEASRGALDGLSAVLMAVAVVGLLSALSPTLRDNPAHGALWIAAAFGVNFSLQIAAHSVFRAPSGRVAKSIIAGNRNIALFLIALPATVTDPILPFIGAYQLPMYLTPVLMAPFYRPKPA